VRDSLLAEYVEEVGIADAGRLASSYFGVVDRYIKRCWEQEACPVHEDIVGHAHTYYRGAFSRELLDGLLSYTREIYLAALKPILVDGAEGFLRWAYLQWPLYIISDAYTLDGRTLDRVLAHDGILNLFKRTYYSDQLGVRKPNPCAVREICSSQAIRSSQLIHIGDLPERDGLLSTNSGCKFVLFGSGAEVSQAPSGSGVVVHSPTFSDLRKVLAGAD
jgi:FMN phosphatase YigB (HAD superfamily)